MQKIRLRHLYRRMELDWLDSIRLDDACSECSDEEPTMLTCCDTPTLFYDHGDFLCGNCGTVDPHRTELVFTPDYNSNLYRWRQYQPYRRQNYFKHKMDLLCANAYPPSPDEWHELIDALRKTQFVMRSATLFQNKTEEEQVRLMIASQYLQGLRDTLKSMEATIYYKFVYLIVFTLFGIRCFRIPRLLTPRLCYEWREYERRFKQRGTRKNSYNYNIILKHILMRNNIPNTELLIMPLNHVKVMRELQELLCDSM